jgi:acetyltransferase
MEVIMFNNQIDEFETKQGTHVCVRPLLSDDAPHLVKIFEHMGPESRYKRFNQPLQKLSKTRVWEEAEEIAQIDPSRSKGLVAFADMPDEPQTAIAAARYVRVDEVTAEAAISVRDDMQRQGIGSRLMRLLVDVAREDGLRRLVATIQNDNHGIWKILQRLPCPATRRYDGPYTHVTIDLTADSIAKIAESGSEQVTV